MLTGSLKEERIHIFFLTFIRKFSIINKQNLILIDENERTNYHHIASLHLLFRFPIGSKSVPDHPKPTA